MFEDKGGHTYGLQKSHFTDVKEASGRNRLEETIHIRKGSDGAAGGLSVPLFFGYETLHKCPK